VGELWGTIKYLHPYLAYQEIDWDAALVRSVAAVNESTTPDEYAAAVQLMLDALDDPATRVVADEPTETASALDATHPTTRMTDDGILVVEMTDYQDLGAWVEAMGRLRSGFAQLQNASAVVVDVRHLYGASSLGLGPGMLLQLSGWNDRLVGTEAAGPGQRYRMHVGLPGVGTFGRGIYSSSFQVQDGLVFGPGVLVAGVPVVFLANAGGDLPPLALALQATGQGAIIAEGSLSDRDVVARATRTLADGVEVEFRIGEIVYADGTGGIAPDLQLEPNASRPEAALERAIAYARTFQPRDNTTRQRLPTVAAPAADDAYPSMLYPSREHRLLAAFRIWAAIEYFFAYKDLMDRDWGGVLREFIPKFEAAADSLAYALTVAEMVTHIQDSHGFLSSFVLMQYFGTGYPPVRVRFIEDVPVVTGYTVDSVARASGLAIGDEIVTLDGEPIDVRIGRIKPYYAASTPDALMRNVAQVLLAGPDGVDALVTVRRADGSETELRVPRSRMFMGSPNYRTTDVVRMLDSNVGYVDLDRLKAAEVPQVYSELADAAGIVFDMRGYPDDNVWTIAAWLGLRPDVSVAQFRQPIVMAATGEGGRTYQSYPQFLPFPAPEATFDGPTVMLVDERSQSSSEHTGLVFHAANDTRFVGSHTAGANGNVTTFVIPGGISVTFTGLDTRHPDGSQLQRVGIVPDLFIKPTIAGVRAGRDEVLEAAVSYVRRLVRDPDER
jgi:C-terminal processing protease CtpA/Prc